MTDAPSPPFRVDLDAWLIAEGREVEADTHYQCACGAVEHSKLFRDVRDRPDLFASPFVCGTCASDLERQELIAFELAYRAWQASEGTLDGETLNGLRAQRDAALQRSDWTQLADNRDRLGPTAAAAWDVYRAAVRAWFATARDTGEVGPMPEPPSDPIMAEQEIEP